MFKAPTDKYEAQNPDLVVSWDHHIELIGGLEPYEIFDFETQNTQKDVMKRLKNRELR